MKLSIKILKIFTGLIFIFSGFVKAVDPVGTQIKFEDYFFALGLDFMVPAALVFSLILNALELVLGFLLVINFIPKITLYASAILMAVFTPLTLWLAIYNPVTDCGCFGDAVTLSNWQTFWKNIFIDILLALAFLFLKYSDQNIKIRTQIYTSASLAVLVFLFELYNILKSPVIDFRPYKEGTNIIKNMEYPENAEKDIYETKIIYKNLKTGNKKEFNIDNCPYDDTLTWSFDTTINILIKKGYEPPIHDFLISDIFGNDITDKILKEKNYSFVIISHDLEKSNSKDISKIKEISKYAESKKLKIYCFTASGEKIIRRFSLRYPRNIEFCTADKKMLQTFVRSNPSLVILKDAVIIKKFSYFEIPKTIDLLKYIK